MAMAAKLALTDRVMTLDTNAMKAHQDHRSIFIVFFQFSAMISTLRLRPLPDERERSILFRGFDDGRKCEGFGVFGEINCEILE